MAALEARLKALEDMIAELRDLQAITKLDIINLRNALEQAKFGIVPELPKIERAEKAKTGPAEKVSVEAGPAMSADELMSLISDIGELRSGLEELRNAVAAITVPKVPEVRDWSADIQRLGRRLATLNVAIKELRKKRSRLRAVKISKADIQKRLREITTKDLQKSVKADMANILKRLAGLEKSIRQLASRLAEVERQISI